MATYKPLQTTTLTASTSSITFSGIDQSYTDLIVEISGQSDTAGNVRLTFNGDTSSTNYSYTFFDGDGTSATSSRASNQAFATAGYIATSNFDVCKVHLNSYSNTTTYKTALAKASAPNRGLSSWVLSTWRSASAITSLKLEIYGSGAYRNWQPGTTVSIYGIKSGAPQALGGDTVFTDGTYWYHTFRTTQTFTPLRPLTAEVLVVAGGGGASNSLGGGGAGGIIYRNSTISAVPLTVTVGAGGAGNSTQNSVNGNDSYFGSLQAFGGGGGSSATTSSAGRAGGSGGGSENGNFAGGASTQTSNNGGTGYGNAGGTSTVNVNYRGGGGGGAGGVGKANNDPSGAVMSVGGAGGAGLGTWSTWANATGTGDGGWFGGGGGSGAVDNLGGVGGQGGGGTGGQSGTSFGAASKRYAASGLATTGGGAGGPGWAGDGYGAGGSGGSGVVLVRYPV